MRRVDLLLRRGGMDEDRYDAKLHPPDRQPGEAASAREPNGEPLTQRIPSGRPYSRKARSKQGRTHSIVGSVIRSSIRKRLRLSVVVSGSIRCWSRVRNQPLKSALHSSLGSIAGVQDRCWSSGRRRRFTGTTRPARLRMLPIVEAAGQASSGTSRSRTARSLRAPKRKRRSAAITVAAIALSVFFLHCSGARERSLNHSGSPLCLRLRHS